jgi:DNA repair protein RadC
MSKRAPSSDNKREEAPDYLGHRDRLRARFVASKGQGLADYELLEMILFAAIPRRDVKPIAKALIKECGGFGHVFAAELETLTRVKGVSENTAVLIKTIYAAAKKMHQDVVVNQPILNSWKSLIDYCHVTLAHEKKEHFRVLFLDRKNKLMADEIQQTGTVDHAPVYPREIMKRALEVGATALILVHNHPSGDPQPSVSDIDMTAEIVKLAEMLGIVVHDHIIIAKSGYVSFKAKGLL